MDKQVVKYSELLDTHNRSHDIRRHQKPTSIKLRECTASLKPYLLHFNTQEEVKTNFHLLLEKIDALPEGTFFSLASLAASTSRTIAIQLGKKLSDESKTSMTFEFATAWSGKWIYRRNHRRPDLVADFEVTLFSGT